MAELVDVVNENNELIGASVTRHEAHSEGMLHRSAHILIYNSKGDVLLQLRAKNKKTWPDTWDISVAGHVDAGEDPKGAALRELGEEIGLYIDEGDLEFWSVQRENKKFGNIHDNEFVYVYLLRHDELIDASALQANEVQTIKFISVDTAEQDLRQNGNYVPHVYWLEIFDQIRQKSNLLV